MVRLLVTAVELPERVTCVGHHLDTSDADTVTSITIAEGVGRLRMMLVITGVLNDCATEKSPVPFMSDILEEYGG